MIRLPRTLEAQSWDAASNARDTCPKCGEQSEEPSCCEFCGYGEDDAYGKYLDAMADKADADRDDAFDAECEARR